MLHARGQLARCYRSSPPSARARVKTAAVLSQATRKVGQVVAASALTWLALGSSASSPATAYEGAQRSASAHVTEIAVMQSADQGTAREDESVRLRQQETLQDQERTMLIEENARLKDILEWKLINTTLGVLVIFGVAMLGSWYRWLVWKI